MAAESIGKEAAGAAARSHQSPQITCLLRRKGVGHNKRSRRGHGSDRGLNEITAAIKVLWPRRPADVDLLSARLQTYQTNPIRERIDFVLSSLQRLNKNPFRLSVFLLCVPPPEPFQSAASARGSSRRSIQAMAGSRGGLPARRAFGPCGDAGAVRINQTGLREHPPESVKSPK